MGKKEIYTAKDFGVQGESDFLDYLDELCNMYSGYYTWNGNSPMICLRDANHYQMPLTRAFSAVYSYPGQFTSSVRELNFFPGVVAVQADMIGRIKPSSEDQFIPSPIAPPPAKARFIKNGNEVDDSKIVSRKLVVDVLLKLKQEGLEPFAEMSATNINTTFTDDNNSDEDNAIRVEKEGRNYLFIDELALRLILRASYDICNKVMSEIDALKIKELVINYVGDRR